MNNVQLVVSISIKHAMYFVVCVLNSRVHSHALLGADSFQFSLTHWCWMTCDNLKSIPIAEINILIERAYNIESDYVAHKIHLYWVKSFNYWHFIAQWTIYQMRNVWKIDLTNIFGYGCRDGCLVMMFHLCVWK